MEKTDKKYSAAEAAIRILDHVKKMYQNSNLNKSNTAHEIEAGQEPVTQNTECPEQLAASKSLKSSKKKLNDSGNPEIEGEEDESEEGEEKEIPEHEEGLSPEEKAIHDSTESESDEEEVEEDENSEAQERDEQDPDNIEESEESPEQKMGDEEESEEESEDESEEDESEEGEESEEKPDKEKDTKDIIDGVVKDKKKPPFMKSEVDKACGLKSPKLAGFVKNRELKKAKVDEEKTDSEKRKERIERGNNRIVVGSNKVFGRDKGVHSSYIDPSGKTHKGKSRAGMATDHAKYNKEIITKDSNKKYAKKQHQKVLLEQKQMKKPNLPKSEDNKVVATKKVEKMLGMQSTPSNNQNNPKDAYKKPVMPKAPKVNEGY